MRYLMWQFRHLHTYYFVVTGDTTTCPKCHETYQKRKPLSISRDDVTPSAQTEKSRYAQWSFYLIFAALGFLVGALVALAIGLTPVASLAITGFLMLTSISLAILSLRDTA